MKTIHLLATGLAAFLGSSGDLAAQTMPEMPKPLTEHVWLQQLAGNWESEMECTMEPGKPPMKNKMTEQSRSVGGFWLVSEGSGDAMGSPFSSILTLGYNPDKKKFVGTWIDSMTHTMWSYEGELDADRKTLTLNSEGPCPMQGGKICKFKEVIVLKNKDHKTFTSSILGEDGEWSTVVSAKSVRTK